MSPPGVVVVSDGHGLRDSVERSGDEPLMLARAVPGAVVCVCSDRYLAGTLAERALGATVHILDDGFQHVGLARNLDVLVTTPGEIPRGHVLPRGRLREPADAAARAHVLVVMGATAGGAAAEGWALGVALACGASRTLGEPIAVASRGSGMRSRASGLPADTLANAESGRRTLGAGARIVVACGIANPQRFVDDVKAVGWQVVGECVFPDHRRFTGRDVARIESEVTRTGASAVLTTDKDAVRFEVADPFTFPLFRVPITVSFDPPHVLFESVVEVLPPAVDVRLPRGDARAPSVGGAGARALGEARRGRP